MKYRLNSLPVKTTNGFHINDVEVDLEIPKFQMKQEYQISGDISSLTINHCIKKEECSSRIGLSFDTYYLLSIVVPHGVVVDEPILIEYDFQKDDILFDVIDITYEENSSCSFVFKYVSKDQENHFHHLIEKVHSGDSSSGNITIINQLNEKSKSFYALENSLDENSSIIHTLIDIGASLKINNVYSELTGFSSQNCLNTIYFGQDHDLLDYQYYLKNIGKETHNTMNVQGVLKDFSHKKFRGTIDFIEGCSHSIGEEQENCVLLSDDCISRSLPQMLCGEEDVVGSHGVSSGKVSEEKLFYLMSRGYSKKEAEKILVMAGFQEILQNVPSSLQQDLMDCFEQKLS